MNRIATYCNALRLPRTVVLSIAMAAGACEAVPPGQTANSTELGTGLARLSMGTSGYMGEIRPITSPIALRYREVHDASLIIRGIARAERGRETVDVATEYKVKWTVRPFSQNALMDLRLMEMKRDRNTLAPKAPILQVIAMTSEMGQLLDMTVSFPFAKETNRPEPDKNSDVYKQGMEAIRLGFIPFNAVITKPGDRIYSMNLTDVVARTLGMEFTEAEKREMQWIGDITAVGLTTVNQRISMLARFEARMAERKSDADNEIRVEGYQAIDLATGMTNDALIRTRLERRRGGIVEMSADVISTMKTTY